MGFGVAAAVPVKPRLACLGNVESVGEPKLSEKGVYYTLPIKLKAVAGGRDATFRLLFCEHWLKSDYDPVAEGQSGEAGAKRAGVYYQHIANERVNKKTGDVIRTASLQILAGENFEALVAAVSNPENQTPQKFAEVVAAAAVGNGVGYVLKQSKDEDGELTDFYEVQSFFHPTKEALARKEKQAADKGDLVITWNK